MRLGGGERLVGSEAGSGTEQVVYTALVSIIHYLIMLLTEQP